MSVFSICFLKSGRSVRFASAFLIAASMSMTRGASVGCSLGVKRVVQKSGCFGFIISVRSWSWARLDRRLLQ